MSNSRDRWFWDLNGSGTYRVKDVRNMLDEFFLPKEDVATRWLPHLPIKLNVFAWRLYLDRLPTKSNLIRRGIQVDSPICPNCISYDEDVPHIFFKCTLAIEVSRVVCRWWDVVWVPCGSYSEWLSWLLSIKMGPRIKSLFEGVWYVSWWTIWMHRNLEIFSSKKPRKAMMFDDIVERSFLWFSSRCKFSFSWDVWCKNPSLISL